MNNLFENIQRLDEDRFIVELQSNSLLDGFNINAKNANGYTLLAIALLTNKIKVSEFILSEYEGLDFTYGKNVLNNCMDVIKLKKLDHLIVTAQKSKEVPISHERPPEPKTIQPVSEDEVLKRIRGTPTQQETKPEPVKKDPPKKVVTADLSRFSLKKDEQPVNPPKPSITDSELKAIKSRLETKKQEVIPSERDNVVKKTKTTMDALKERMAKGKNIWKRINNEE